jgi:hypothetical protein
VEVLTRGPVHEAFAETVTFDPEPGIVIPQAPPDPIEELAPDQRPEGPNVAWIPGYWGWEDDRNDFIWISGIWRSLPPGRQWMPGYWADAQEGAQWISGYWADATLDEIEYLPEPPATVEAGPNIDAPAEDEIWLPGCWIWQQNRYVWRPGYWSQGNQDWDWVPAHYVWTPGGYVFVDGYYDYSVRRRGVVFAPVYLTPNLRTQRGYAYSPTTVINPSVFIRHLFLRPSYGHYYFGDYYAADYADAGFSPWFSYHSSRRGYEPIYANQRWQHRSDHEWAQRAEANFQRLRNDENARPPRNWASQAALAAQVDASTRRNRAVASQLQELAQRKNARLRFEQVNPAEQQQYGQRGQEYRKYLQQRQQLEANTTRKPSTNSVTVPGPERRTFSRSPYAAPPANQLRGDYAPPQRHQVREPDPRVQPPPRTREGTPGTLPAGQVQVDPQAKQRQGENKGKTQKAPAGRSQPRGGTRGENSKGRSNGNQERGSEKKSNSNSNK